MVLSAKSMDGSERLRSSDLGDDVSFLLARANALSLAAANAVLVQLGLRVRSYAVLSLAVAGVRPSQRELSEFLRLDPSQVVGLIDELEEQRLVGREPDPNDRRAKVIVATTQGRRVFARAKAATAAAERTLHANLSDEERATLVDMLRRIAYP